MVGLTERKISATMIFIFTYRESESIFAAEEKRDDLLEEVGLADRKICAAKEQSALIKNRCKQWKEGK